MQKTFKQYLLEDKADLSDFEKNAALMLEKEIYLFRGTDTARHSMDVGPYSAYINSARTIQRRPKGSDVFARLSTNWEIPDRKLSYFVTRDANHADQFGNLQLIIPSDDVKLYAWSATDFNFGASTHYKSHLKKIIYFTKDIKFAVSYFDIDSHFAQTDNATKLFLKTLEEVDIDVEDLDKLGKAQVDDPKLMDYIDALLKKYDQFELYASESSSTVANRGFDALTAIKIALEKMKLTKIADAYAGANAKSFKIKTFTDLSQLPKRPKSSDELWFNGKYLAVNISSRHGAQRIAAKILKLIVDGELVE